MARQRDEEKAKKLRLDDEAAEEAPEATETADEAGRDYNKARWFHKNLALLPAEVRNMFESNTLSRKDKTKLINEGVVRDEKGRMSFDAENPVT